MKKILIAIFSIIFSLALMIKINAEESDFTEKDGWYYYNKSDKYVEGNNYIIINNIDKYQVQYKLSVLDYEPSPPYIELSLKASVQEPEWQWYINHDNEKTIRINYHRVIIDRDRAWECSVFSGDRLLFSSINKKFELRYKIKGYLENEMPATTKQELLTVDFNIQNSNQLEIIINDYPTKARIIKYLENEDDLKIFENTPEAYYQNYNNNPQIIISHDNTRLYLRDILEAKISDKEAPAFLPHSIWNLKTNEIKTILNYKAYTYISTNDNSAIVAYFYTDEFIIDKMLKISVQYNMRVIGKILGIEYYNSGWKKFEETYTNEDYLKYKDYSTDFRDLIPVWNLILLYQREHEFFEMPRIEAVEFDNRGNSIQDYYNVSKSQIEDYIKSVDSEFETIKADYRVFGIALHQGANYFGAKYEFYNNEKDIKDPMNLHIINILYETNGKLYETYGKDIDLRIKIDENTPNAPGNPDNDNINWIALIICEIISIVIMILSLKFSKKKSFLITFLVVIIFTIILGPLLYYLWNSGIIEKLVGKLT